MSQNEENDTDSFFSEANEEELRSLVSVYDSNQYISWKLLKEQNEDFTVKTWGNAIEKGIVNKEGQDTYNLEYRSEISDYLSGSNDNNSDNEEESSSDTEIDREELPEVDYESADWQKQDIAVAILSGVSLIGFSQGTIRSVIYSVVDIPIGLLDAVLPFFAVIFVLTIFTSAWSHFVRERLKSTDASSFRERIQGLRGDDDDGGLFGQDPTDVDDENQEEIMRLQTAMMKAQIKPFGWIMLMTIPVIIWVLSTAQFVGAPPEPVVFPILGERVWSSTIIGPFEAWLFWYVVCSVTLTQVVKKYVPLD